MHVVRSHQGGDLPLGSLLEIGFLSGRGKLTVVILAPFESTNPPPRFARLWAASRAGVGPVRVPTTPRRSPGRCGARAPSARIRPREGAPSSSSRQTLHTPCHLVHALTEVSYPALELSQVRIRRSVRQTAVESEQLPAQVG